MKNNKLFNKVLSKSAMLLMVAGITMSSGAAFNVYAQEVPAASEIEAAQADNASNEKSASDNAATEKAKTTVKYTWSYKITQTCKPNATVKPATSKPSTGAAAGTETSKPSTSTGAEASKPSTSTGAEASKPSTSTGAEASKPSTSTGAEASKPSTSTGAETSKPSAGTEAETSKPSTGAAAAETSKPSTETVSNQAAFENEVLRLVNVERAKQGLSALQMDESIRTAARDKAADMYKNNYFSHTSPTYGSPFDMLKQYGISYKSAGENIAKGQTTPEQVVNSWMNSSGHRANILNANYTHIGIGYEANGNEWVQMFVGR